MTEQDTPKMTHEEMIDTLKGLVFGTFDRTTAKEREALDMAISALSENTGEWISTEDRPDGFCSKCDTDIYEVSTPYCPYCGAKMTWVGAIHEPYKKGE